MVIGSGGSIQARYRPLLLFLFNTISTMIKMDEIYLADLQDDFEEIGRGQVNFTLDEFLQNDINRAFAFGYACNDWKEKGMWFPVSIRKEIRHLADNTENYNAQLNWLNSKCDSKIKSEDYVEYILDNLFYENKKDKIKIAILLGNTLKRKYA